MRAWTAKSATVTGERSSFVSARRHHFPLNAAGQERSLANGIDGELGFGRIEHGDRSIFQSVGSTNARRGKMDLTPFSELPGQDSNLE